MARDDGLLARIARSLGGPEVIDALATKLAPRDLSSLLLHVFEARTGALDARAVLERFEAQRVAQPAPSDPRRIAMVSAAAFAAAEAFEAVELGPVVPLGTAHALGGVHQNNVLSASRHVEVVADTSSALALEAARRRRAVSPSERSTTRLVAEARVVRMQPLSDPRFFPHFRLSALASAGRDGGGAFDLTAAREHVFVHLDMFRRLRGAGFAPARITVEVTDPEVVTHLLERAGVALDELRTVVAAHKMGASAEFLAARGVNMPRGPRRELDVAGLTPHLVRRLDHLDAELCQPIAAHYPEVEVAIDLSRLEARAYYRGLCFRISAETREGHLLPVVDGGALDWMTRLLGDRRERLVASGFGPELVAALLQPQPEAP